MPPLLSSAIAFEGGKDSFGFRHRRLHPSGSTAVVWLVPTLRAKSATVPSIEGK